MLLQAKAVTAMEVAVERGRGWEPGQLRARLQALVDQYADTPKEPVYTYDGGPIGPTPALHLICTAHAPLSSTYAFVCGHDACYRPRISLMHVAWQPSTLTRVYQQPARWWRLHECFCSSVAGTGEGAARILEAWQAQAPVLPPENWRPPPPAGYLAAQGMRRAEDEPWRPVRAAAKLWFLAALLNLRWAKVPCTWEMAPVSVGGCQQSPVRTLQG